MQLLSCNVQAPCAGGGKGRPRPLHPRPGACAPWNPDLMHSRAKRLVRMPLGRCEQQALIQLSAQRKHESVLYPAKASLAGGVLGEPASVPLIGGEAPRMISRAVTSIGG